MSHFVDYTTIFLWKRCNREPGWPGGQCGRVAPARGPAAAGTAGGAAGGAGRRRPALVRAGRGRARGQCCWWWSNERHERADRPGRTVPSAAPVRQRPHGRLCATVAPLRPVRAPRRQVQAGGVQCVCFSFVFSPSHLQHTFYRGKCWIFIIFLSVYLELGKRTCTYSMFQLQTTAP